MIDASRQEHGVCDAEIRFTEADANVAAALSLTVGAPIALLERTITSKGSPVIATVDCIDYEIVERASAPLTPESPGTPGCVSTAASKWHTGSHRCRPPPLQASSPSVLT